MVAALFGTNELVKNLSQTPSNVKPGDQIKREIFAHLKNWIETGNAYSRRLALTKSAALRKGAK